MGGIILGAIGGVGEALENMGVKEQAAQSAQDLESLRASLEQQKEQRLEAYKDRGVTGAKSYIAGVSTQVMDNVAPPATVPAAVSSPSSQVPAPQDGGVSQPTIGKGKYDKESDLRQTASGDMGASPGGYQRIIQQDQEALKTETIPAARDMLNADIAEMTRQSQKYGGGVAPASSASPSQARSSFLESSYAPTVDPVAADSKPGGIITQKMRDRTTPEVLAAAYDAALRDGKLDAAKAIKEMMVDKNLVVGANSTVFDTTTGKVVFSNDAGEKMKLEGILAESRKTELKEDGKDRRTKADNDARAELEMKRLTAGMTPVQQSAWVQQVRLRMEVPGATLESAIRSMDTKKDDSPERTIINIAGDMELSRSPKPPPGADAGAFYMAEAQKRYAIAQAGGKASTSGVNPLPTTMSRPPIADFNRP